MTNLRDVTARGISHGAFVGVTGDLTRLRRMERVIRQSTKNSQNRSTEQVSAKKNSSSK